MKGFDQVEKILTGALPRPAGMKSPAQYREAYGAGSYRSYVTGWFKRPAGSSAS